MNVVRCCREWTEGETEAGLRTWQCRCGGRKGGHEERGLQVAAKVAPRGTRGTGQQLEGSGPTTILLFRE